MPSPVLWDLRKQIKPQNELSKWNLQWEMQETMQIFAWRSVMTSWNHPSDAWAPTENPLRTAWLMTSYKAIRLHIHLAEVPRFSWNCFESNPNVTNQPWWTVHVWQSAPSVNHEYIVVICVLSNCEISCDNESVQAGSKVEPLWPLEIIITCKTVLI